MSKASTLGPFVLVAGGATFCWLNYKRDTSDPSFQFWSAYIKKSHETKAPWMERIFRDFTEENARYGPVVKATRLAVFTQNFTLLGGAVFGLIAGYAGGKAFPQGRMLTSIISSQFCAFGARYLCTTAMLLPTSQKEREAADKEFLKYFTEKAKAYTTPQLSQSVPESTSSTGASQ
jgi:hypothetical protein